MPHNHGVTLISNFKVGLRAPEQSGLAFFRLSAGIALLITGFPLVLKSPENVMIFASVILKNQDTESVIFFSSNILFKYYVLD